MKYSDFAKKYIETFFNASSSDVILNSLRFCGVSLICNERCKPVFRIAFKDKAVFVTPRTVNGKRILKSIQQVVKELPLTTPSEEDLNRLFLIILEGHHFRPTIQDALIRMIPYTEHLYMYLDAYCILRMYLYYRYDPDCKVYVSPYSVEMFRNKATVDKIVEAFISKTWNYYAPTEVLRLAVKKNISFAKALALHKILK